MAINIGDSVGGGTVGSVLFVGAGTVLAQDNIGFYFDPATNTLKTRNETNSDSASFAIGTGDVGGSSTGGSGALTIETGDGSPNTSGTDAAGNSGAVTVSTGPGGNSDNGSLAGNSGNLNLKTGSGGGNAFSGFSGGNAGNIILQPGSGGSGPAGQGVGGSTLLRASNSGDILAVQNSAGTTTHLGVGNNGNVRIGTASSGALLQLGAGTATLPPLKLTAGTVLTSPSAGAIEWDGTKLFITSGALRKELTLSHLAVVTDFGAKGDGTTDESAAVQAAVGSLADQIAGDGNGTGGVVCFPPNKKFKINSSIDIRSNAPIFIVSQQQIGRVTTPGSIIIPGAAISNGIFRWRRPAGNSPADAGGGGLIGVHVMDTNFRGGGFGNGNGYALDSAVNIEDCLWFFIRDCSFTYIKGRALDLGNASGVYLESTKIQYCGDSTKPSIDIRGGDHESGWAGLWADTLIMHESFGAPYIKIAAKTGVSIKNSYFESTPALTTPQTIIDATDTVTEPVVGRPTVENSILNAATAPAINSNRFRTVARGCAFTQGTTTASTVRLNHQQCVVTDCTFNGGQGKAIEFAADGDLGRAIGNNLYSCGNIDAASAHYVQICDNYLLGCASNQTYQIESGTFGLVSGNYIHGNSSSTVAGIKALGAVVSGNVVQFLNNANGIVSTWTTDVLTGNLVDNLNGGTAYTYANGCRASGNQGYPTSASDSNSDDVIVLHAESGTLTTKSLSTTADNSYSFTVTNQMAASGSRVVLSVRNGSNSGGVPVISSGTRTAGSFGVTIHNAGSTAFNGTLIVEFQLIN